MRYLLAGLGAAMLIIYQSCDSGFESVSNLPSSSGSQADPDPTPTPTPDPPGTPPPTGTAPQPNASLNIGTLAHDGPPTPEQISMVLPLTGSVDYAAKASVLYRKAGTSTWYQGHPLHRLRPEFSESNSNLMEGFAGIITGLDAGVTYEIRVTVQAGTQTDVRDLTFTTRNLPAPSGAATKIISSGSTSAEIKSVLGSVTPGDVVEFENGTYTVDKLQVAKGGTESAPVVIRGASRNGVVLKATSGSIIQITEASHLIIERLTLEGSGVDSGIAASSVGINLWSGYAHKNVTMRGLKIRGVDMGIVGHHLMESISVYDCTLNGNNRWDQDLFPYNGSGAPGAGDGIRDGEQNVFWNDDGLRIPGRGNVIFNNTLNGFGDAMAVTSGVHNAGVHFYRNEVTMTGDDGFEGDYANRNISFYDNRIHNAMTFISFDPLYGGPAFIFRNIAINIRRGPYKLNATNTGIIMASNTVVATKPASESLDDWAWVQFNNGAIRAWSYRNNILIRRNVPKLMAMEASGQDPIDFTHNGWFPDGAIWWNNNRGSSGTSLSDTFAKMESNTTPVFGESTRRHEHDVIVESNPFEVDVALGADYRTLVTARYSPKLKATSSARGAGVAIPGVTDGFTGGAPDIGAVITGRGLPVFGDRTP